MQTITGNIKVKNNNLEKLKKDFPECFDKNGDFDFEKFKRELQTSEIDFSKESYGLDWLGKSYARVLASDEATTLLKEDEDFNQKEENKNSQNLLIKGDNLEVLKHLSNAYYEKIKMIYIDPPYNTGSDGFVYQDDRKFTIKELSQLAGIDEEKAKRILEFTESKSNSHSAWLTFMYPRLYIARQLLKDDGVIFVSIDDNEVAQLRLLMDEIFGEENFVNQLVWRKKAGGSSDSKHFAIEYEYIILYSKCKNSLQKFKIDYSDKEQKRFNLNDNKGKYYLKTIELPNGLKASKGLDYKIKCPDETLLDNINGKKVYWVINEENFKKLKKEGRIVFKKIKNGEWRVYRKIYMGEQVPRGLFYDIAINSNATSEMKFLFDDNQYFSNPKPTKLIKYLLKIIVKSNDLILDFFAGSGTAGDAVMQLNAEDGGDRKYILVQLPEPIDPKKNKTAYDFVKNELKIENPTIFEITKERLIRASKKIKEESSKDLTKDLSKVDFGFKIFETTPIWEDYNFQAEEFSPQAKLFDESKLSNKDLKTLLVTWKTYDGIALTEDLKEIDLDEYKGYYFDTKIYLVNKGFKTNNLNKLLEEIDKNKDFNPATIIAFGYNFESKSLREISENIKSYTNKKDIDIDFITRY